MATSKPLRLDLELVRAADAAARRQKRSVPHQIEFWAELGRSVEKLIDPDSLIAVQEGLARLVVEMAPSAPVSSYSVFEALELSRNDGTLANRVADGPVRYQASSGRPGLLEQLRPDGSKSVGRFTGGQFVPIEE
jgi:hypothetical protein